jgi:hypothetical protein
MDHNAEETLPARYTQPEPPPFHVTVSEQMEPLTLEVTTR